MSKLAQILSNAATRLSAIEDRVSQKADTVLDQSVLQSPMASLKTPKAGEVTLFGHYVWDPEISDQEEIDILLAGHWSPSVLDFMAVTGLSAKFAIGNFEALLLSIAEYKVDSISRLNFFTHGNSVTLGIAGTIDDSNVYFDSYIDESKMDLFSDPTLTISDGKKTITIDDVRKRFKKDAIFVLYACHGGANKALLKALCKLLQVTIIGFEHAILYCPPVQTAPPFKRKGSKIGIAKNEGGCPGNTAVADWRALISDETAIKFVHK